MFLQSFSSEEIYCVGWFHCLPIRMINMLSYWMELTSHMYTHLKRSLSLSLSLSLLYAWSWTHCWLINLGWYTFKVQAFNKLNGVDYSTEGHGGDNSQGFRILQQHPAHHSVLRGSYREPHCKDLFIRSKRSLLHTKPHIIHSCYNF